MTDRDGRLLREVRPDGRGTPVALEVVSPAAISALISAEDRHFYRHPGVNPLALVRAAWVNYRSGKVISGGSTITMQVARAIRGETRRGFLHKLAEIHLALRLEVHLSKQEILERWLNVVPFGNQAFGIESAAQLYFGKSARDLTIAEAAYLIGLPQSPSRYNPFRNSELAESRQRRVLAAMERNGTLDRDVREQIELIPVALQPPDLAFQAPHFTQSVLSFLRGDVGNLREIQTTLDIRLQKAVEDLLRGHLRALIHHNVSNGAAIVLDNRTGDILAYVGSANFWDDRIGGQNDGVRMLRQPGSALKPFTYALALQTRRYAPSTILADIELNVPEAGGAFSPVNYDRRFRGPVPMREALAGSYNVPAVRLARELGPARLLPALHLAGFASLDRSPDYYGIGLTLGNGEVQLLELARAYAGFSRGGSLPDVSGIRWYRTTEGTRSEQEASGAGSRFMDPQIAFLITEMLSNAEARAPAFGRGGALEMPFPAAVKTGTSKDYRDNWAVGYTPTHTVAVWMGNFDGKPMRWVSGVTGAAPLLKSIFTVLGTGGAFERPRGLEEATVCPVGGMLPGAACPTRKMELFLPGTAPRDTCTVHQLLTVDRRTGLLADEDTPASERRTERYLVYPPLYHAWMLESGIPLPPRVSSRDIEARIVTAATDSYTYSDALAIQYPESGITYTLDPVLRETFQQIHLRGTASEGMFDVAWWVNGARFANDLLGAALPLRSGTHTIELRAISAGGEAVRSRPVRIRVE